MDLSYDIRQKQHQKLALSARMRESLDILQISLPDLLRKIDKEIMENPVLECNCTEETDTKDSAELPQPKEQPPRVQIEWYGENSRSTSPDSETDVDSFLFVAKEPTFSDFLLEQLREIKTNAKTAKICRYLIEDLDERGYLPESAEIIAKNLRLADPKLVERAIGLIRQMEPAGVGASDLRECLTLQLQRCSDSSPAEFAIVERYLELVADNKIRLIAEKLGISVSDAQKYCDRIRSLTPIPSRGFHTGTREKFVIPDAVIRRDEGKCLTVEMNGAASRRLSIDPFYRELAQTAEDQEARKYIREKITTASSLIREVSQRTGTVARILEQIIDLQPAYFESGTSGLKPMTMKQIAERLGLNESTVSRAVQDKFILCPAGLVSIKSLFTAQLRTEDSSGVSAAEVKNRIQQCVDSENKEDPLSDQAIVAKMQAQGIVISRRTVAKYRGELNIPVMAKRKVY